MTKSILGGQRSIAITISLAAVALIAALLGAFAFAIAKLNHDLVEKKAITQVEEQTKLVKSLLTTLDTTLRGETKRLIGSLAASLPGEFTLSPEERVTIRGVSTPALYNGSERLNLDTTLLDRFTQSSGAAATVFARDGSDFVRVATTLKNEKGEVVLGTKLAANHPAMKLLLAGESYIGRAVLFGKDYITAYQPIFDASGRVVGSLFVGLDVSASVRNIKDQIVSLKVGETGYFYGLDARPGDVLGNLVFHPVQEGKNILGATDADGHAFIKEMLDKKSGIIHYPWINSSAGETKPRMKVVVYDYLPEWDWVIGGGAYDDELSRDGVLLRNVTLAVAGAVVVILGILLFLMMRKLVGKPLAEAMRIFALIGEGRYDNEIALARKDEIGSLFKSLDTMQKSLDERTRAEARVASEALRIKSALDKASTNMMVSDTDGQIIYMNDAVMEMMQAAEADMRKDLPNFRAAKLLGSTFDEFHRNPAHQRSMLAALKTTHRAEIKVGGRTFRLVANPVIDEKGVRLGSVVEWTDRTSEVEAENELAALLEAAVRGDFTSRLSMDGKSGFFRDLAEGMNQLLEIVSSGLADIARVLASIAKGDLTQRIDAHYEGTFGQLKENTNSTVDQLMEVVVRIKEATDAINTAAGEIASGNSDLSSRTETQASSLEETASAMEELNSTVKQNAQNAREAHNLTQTTNDMAGRGGEIVQRVVGTMGTIQESSRQIADIIGVIDSIAFQTNILALNAAVEAARAGEQGKGFAVVASEVRSLAQRSAQAAKEIKALIDDSVTKVDGGAQLVQEAGQTMTEIVDSFRHVTTLVTEIAEASREQSTGIEQVSQAVTQMDEVTQQNAALVEEAAAAAESLEEQAISLSKAVSIFKINEQSAVVRTAPRAPKAAPRPASKPALVKRPQAPAPRRMAAPAQAQAEDEWEEF